jgi:hypothetical protein
MTCNKRHFMLEYRTSIKDNQMTDIKDIMANSLYRTADIKPIQDKIERLVSAVYLVTGYITDKEPLKWEVRLISSDLLKASLNLIDEGTLLGERLAKLSSINESIASHLRVAKNAGLVSDMNASIIEKEFSNLNELISAFLEGEGKNLSKSLESRIVPKLTSTYVAEKPVEKRVDPVVVRETVPVKRQLLGEITSETNGIKNSQPMSQRKSNRQTVILELVGKMGEIMIKDITPHINGCSEKTIQRELLSLVDSGVLKKTGEKRWSRYSMA